ncbi:MAG: hypothetical protein K0S88_6713, partial [Actinomycetia bacterium]|nr:hypothetical protein [Actinomycetes bacterium]
MTSPVAAGRARQAGLTRTKGVLLSRWPIGLSPSTAASV